MTRKEARECMMKALYQMDLNGDFSGQNLEAYLDGQELGNQKEYCRKLYQACRENKDKIDSAISRYSVKWKIERMPKTDVAILRLTTAEIMFMEGIPSAVSINEAVELAKTYGTEQSPKFVNAILGNIEKEK